MHDWMDGGEEAAMEDRLSRARDQGGGRADLKKKK